MPSSFSDHLTALGDWFEDRTRFRAISHALKDRTLPRGPRWSYATGASTLGLFLVVSVTGVLLMTAYSPAADHGWSSVHHIEETPGGSFLRGLHFYGSHALIVLFAVHLARTILQATFRAPRELAWISGVLLLPLLATQAVTGNPLSASNKAFGQIEVESHVVGNMPVIGSLGRRALLGGQDVGHLTMTHLYTLHVVILPMLAMALLAFHLYQSLRYGTRAAAVWHSPQEKTAERPGFLSLETAQQENLPRSTIGCHTLERIKPAVVGHRSRDTRRRRLLGRR